MADTREYLAAKIREFRKERELTTEELGELVGRSKSAIKSWESGRTQPDADKLIELCRIFKVVGFRSVSAMRARAYTCDYSPRHAGFVARCRTLGQRRD